MDKKRKQPLQERDPTQHTPGTGLEVPVPERGGYFDVLGASFGRSSLSLPRSRLDVIEAGRIIGIAAPKLHNE